MSKRWVDSLFLGNWHLPNGDVFECDNAARDYYYTRAKSLLKSGIPLPVCLEHQPTVGLSFHEKLAEQTRNTIGHCHDVRIGNEGQIQFEVDGDDESFMIMRRNKYVSPEIRQNVIDPRTGTRYPGPSIVHLACTPRPIQVTGTPHVSLSAAGAINLAKVAVDVSLSAATYSPAKKPKDADMPFPPKKIPGGEDLEGSDPVLVKEEKTEGATMGAEEGAAIAELTSELSELGIEFHGSASDSLLSFVQHLVTALKTHKSTKAVPTPNQDQPDPNQPDPTQQDQPDPNQPQEAAVTESAPIMMSQATVPTALETKLKAKILKDNKKDLTTRLNVLHARYWIDDKIKNEQLQKLGTIQLSAADVSDEGDLRPNEVSIAVATIERLMSSGRPAPFAPVAVNKPATNPLKPISSSIALSAGQHEQIIMADPDDGAASLKNQEEAGDELAALAGFPIKR